MLSEIVFKKQVLLVADTPDISKHIGHKLFGGMVCLLIAPSALIAIKILEEKRIDLVFVDIALEEQEISGIDFVKIIRSRNQKLPICMITETNCADTLFNSLLAGANDCIWRQSEKPTPMVLMQQTIDSLLRDNLKAKDSILRSSILKARGLCQSQLQLLSTFAARGFPDIYELADMTQISENALVKRFSRIEKLLGLKNRANLVQLLTICSKYGY